MVPLSGSATTPDHGPGNDQAKSRFRWLVTISLRTSEIATPVTSRSATTTVGTLCCSAPSTYVINRYRPGGTFENVKEPSLATGALRLTPLSSSLMIAPRGAGRRATFPSSETTRFPPCRARRAGGPPITLPLIMNAVCCMPSPELFSENTTKNASRRSSATERLEASMAFVVGKSRSRTCELVRRIVWSNEGYAVYQALRLISARPTARPDIAHKAALSGRLSESCTQDIGENVGDMGRSR